MSVTCKFFKKVTLIKDKNIFTIREQAYAFLIRLDLINCDLLNKLITDQDPKFLGKFQISLFEKLGVKLFYNIVYQLQIDSFSKKTNQTVKILLCFFVHLFKNLAHWLQVFLYIQAIINYSSSLIIRKTLNKMTYNFSLRYLLDFLAIIFTFKILTKGLILLKPSCLPCSTKRGLTIAATSPSL